MVNQQFVVVFFFTVELDASNSFHSKTTEVRPIYLKMGHIMRKPVYVICEQQRRGSACASTYQQMTLSPKLGVVGISTLWHFRLPLPIQMFIKVASSPRLSGIGMPSPIL